MRPVGFTTKVKTTVSALKGVPKIEKKENKHQKEP